MAAASSHAGERGFGFNDMSERHTAWVLSRLAIEMKEYPTAFDKINLYTWIDEVGRLFTSRCFELADENGKTFGFARSIWAAIDVETRRPTLLDIEALGKYIDERPCPIEKPGKIMPAENTINSDKKSKKRAHQTKLFQKYFASCFRPRRMLSRTRLGSTSSDAAISLTRIPR